MLLSNLRRLSSIAPVRLGICFKFYFHKQQEYLEKKKKKTPLHRNTSFHRAMRGVSLSMLIFSVFFSNRNSDKYSGDLI